MPPAKNREVIVEVSRRGEEGDREEQRVWGLTLNPDPEAENAPRMS